MCSNPLCGVYFRRTAGKSEAYFDTYLGRRVFRVEMYQLRM